MLSFGLTFIAFPSLSVYCHVIPLSSVDSFTSAAIDIIVIPVSTIIFIVGNNICNTNITIIINEIFRLFSNITLTFLGIFFILI